MADLKATDLGAEFLQQVHALPQGEKIDACIQCGTCSGSCPTSGAMEYGPREIIAALRAGMLDRVLGSNTVWLCASCYSCAVRCPAKIPLTDVMYELKRLGVKHGIYPKESTDAIMAKAFASTVDSYGRNAETSLLRKYFLHTSPMTMLSQMPLAIRLVLKGRLDFFPKKTKGLADLRKMMAAVEENGEQ